MTNKLPLHAAIDIMPNPPSAEELGDLAIGDFVKVGSGVNGQGSEAFWVIIDRIDGDSIYGEVNNQLRHTDHHGYFSGQKIVLDMSNVFQFIYND